MLCGIGLYWLYEVRISFPYQHWHLNRPPAQLAVCFASFLCCTYVWYLLSNTSYLLTYRRAGDADVHARGRRKRQQLRTRLRQDLRRRRCDRDSSTGDLRIDDPASSHLLRLGTARPLRQRPVDSTQRIPSRLHRVSVRSGLQRSR